MYPRALTGSRRLRQTRRLMSTFAIVSLLVSAALGSVAGRALGADVSVTAVIRPSVAATFAEDGVIVRANTPWQVEAQVATEHGLDMVVITGDATSGTLVPLGLQGSVVSVLAR